MDNEGKMEVRPTTVDDQPIVALCTPQGSGALALIRISGYGAIELVDNITKLSSKKKLINIASHTINHGYVIDQENIIDEVLFFLMKAPRTFTGQDTVEISCHNNQFIINQIINLAIKHGAHHANRGEFTKRAFLSKKIDLLQAEAINDLIMAQNEIALKKSMAQLKGTLSHHISHIETMLITLLSTVEASFEFLDEEQRDLNFDNSIRSHLEKIIKRTNLILENFSQQQQIRQGVRIALIGSTNVGKSTLFNVMAKEERAIVTNIPGTTRDAIETTRYKDGHFWLLIDTAGVRSTKNSIEKKGINRSWQEAAQSDIILLILDATKPMTEKDKKLYEKIEENYSEKIIHVANKIDKAKNFKIKKEAICISAKNKTGIEQLEQKIEEKINKLFATAKTPFLLNQRQHDLLFELHTKLTQLNKQQTDTIHYEIIAYHLKQLIELISQLTGKTINEKMMDTVFKSFCIGK